MRRINYTLTERSLSFFYGEKPYILAHDYPGFAAILQALREDNVEDLEGLLDIRQQITKASVGKVHVEGNRVLYQDGQTQEEVGGPVVDKLLAFMSEGLPYEPIMKFIDRLMANPSRNSREQLYGFLEHKNLPITDEGHFLAYKSVNPEYMDWHSRKFCNKPGTTLEMPRRSVDDNPQNHCSYGFHVGALDYVAAFGGADKKVVIVDVDPADVVSVPTDCARQKVRTCKYTVLEDYTGPLPELYVGQDQDGPEDPNAWWTDEDAEWPTLDEDAQVSW